MNMQSLFFFMAMDRGFSESDICSKAVGRGIHFFNGNRSRVSASNLHFLMAIDRGFQRAISIF